MGKKITTIILSVAALGAVFFCSAKIAYSQDLYRVNSGTSQNINAHGSCKAVENDSSKAILIPVKTSVEWAEFRIHAPSNIPGVSLLDCCGENVTFTYKGSSVTYGTVLSCGKCWMDRNLGASRVATAYNDSAAYGDLFQWGRLDDRHQNRASGITTTLSSADNPGHSNFIYGMGIPYDWRSPQSDNLWQGVSGINNPCPSGWRIPTAAEWGTESSSWSSQGREGAFNSLLKFTAGGYRHYSNGQVLGISVGRTGYYWSYSTALEKAIEINFSEGGTGGIIPTYRASGFSVRCIKD